MTIVRRFDQQKYVLPVQQGSGFADAVSGVASFVSQHKDTFKDVGKATASVTDAVGNISNAVKAAKWFNELREVQLARTALPSKVVSELPAAGRSKKVDGFEKF